jgi:hypothetical protein
MVAHSTPEAGVEWGTQSLGCRCREEGSFFSQLAFASGLLGMTKGSGVSIGDWSHGSQVSKARPGAPFDCYRHS